MKYREPSNVGLLPALYDPHLYTYRCASRGTVKLCYWPLSVSSSREDPSLKYTSHEYPVRAYLWWLCDAAQHQADQLSIVHQAVLYWLLGNTFVRYIPAYPHAPPPLPYICLRTVSQFHDVWFIMLGKFSKIVEEFNGNWQHWTSEAQANSPPVDLL